MSIASNFPSSLPSLLLDFANVKRLDPRITFTRTTTATYYDGVTTAKAEENLLTYSQEFDNAAWTKSNTTVTANSTAAPDGTTTAETLASSNSSIATTGVYVYLGSSGITVGSTLSCYAKANTSSIAWVAAVGSSTAYAVYNLSTQTLIASANCTASLVSVGNSWYRIVLSNITVASDNFIVGGKDSYSSGTPWANGTWTSGNSIYIWGAQLEQRSSATAYVATTSQAITNYIPVLQTAAAGQARFDHNPTTGESLGLLIEEARTNLVTASQTFTTGWTAFNATVTNSAIIAPDGTLTGTKLTTTASTTFQGRYYIVSLSASTAYTFSIYAKAGEYSRLAVDSANIGQVPVALFDLSAGTVVSGTGTITPVGNGWYKCTATKTTTTGGSDYLAVYVNNGSSNSFAGNGFSGIFIWGAQLEAGSFATSYIPTVASTVTRNADAASMTGTNFSSWFNYGAMTIYYEATGYYTASGAYEVFDLDSGSNNGRIRTRFLSSEQASQLDASSTPTFGLDGGTVTANSFAKVAIGLTQNSQALSLNGGTVVTATAPFTTFPVPTTARIGTNWVPSEFLNGTIKKIAFYPVKATNAQLQALTV